MLRIELFIRPTILIEKRGQLWPPTHPGGQNGLGGPPGDSLTQQNGMGPDRPLTDGSIAPYPLRSARDSIRPFMAHIPW